MKICIDAGHGGKDPGAMGALSNEKDNVLKTALAIGIVAEANGIEVVYTRTTDVYLELLERAKIANKEDVDLFISVHNNSYSDPTVGGIETWHYPGSVNGSKLAEYVHTEMINVVDFANRGVKTAKFTVLSRTRMPAILLELGFISNLEEEKLLMSDAFNEIIANAVVKGVCQYFGKDFIEVDLIEDPEIDIEILVKEVQTLLNKWEITDYEDKALVVDGVYGPRTDSAFVKLRELLSS